MYTISVAMAVYNGAEFLKSQVESIIKQLDACDELVISYDESVDDTWEIISEYARNDHRIKVIKNSTKGVLFNFENALKHCTNEIIFLADQDDVWFDNKIETVCKYFNDEDISAVVHGVINVDKDLNVIKKDNNNQAVYREIKAYQIIIKNRVQGSCLAVRKQYIEKALPFPKHIPMHDSWIGLLTATYGKVLYINIPLIFYRRHENSVSPDVHKSLLQMIKDRFFLVVNYIVRLSSCSILN